MNQETVNIAKIVRACFDMVRPQFPKLPQAVTKERDLIYLVETNQGYAVIVDFTVKMPTTMDKYKDALLKSYINAEYTGLIEYSCGGHC